MLEAPKTRELVAAMDRFDVISALVVVEEITEERDRKSAQMKRGDELPSGVLEMVKVYVNLATSDVSKQHRKYSPVDNMVMAGTKR